MTTRRVIILCTACFVVAYSAAFAIGVHVRTMYYPGNMPVTVVERDTVFGEWVGPGEGAPSGYRQRSGTLRLPEADARVIELEDLDTHRREFRTAMDIEIHYGRVLLGGLAPAAGATAVFTGMVLGVSAVLARQAARKNARGFAVVIRSPGER